MRRIHIEQAQQSSRFALLRAWTPTVFCPRPLLPTRDQMRDVLTTRLMAEGHRKQTDLGEMVSWGEKELAAIERKLDRLPLR